MLIDAEALATHLSKILIPRAGIQNVVLRRMFECTARNQDSSVIVVAPHFENVERLPLDIGVDLKTLVGALRIFGPECDLTLEDRLVITGNRIGHSMHVAITDANMVETRIDHDAALNEFPDAEGIPLSYRAWDERIAPYYENDPAARGHMSNALDKAAQLSGPLRAEKVVVEVQSDGAASVFLVGGPRNAAGGERSANLVEISHHFRPTTEQPYRLTFKPKLFAAVLAVVRHAPDPKIHFAGPKQPLMFSDGEGFRWLVRSEESRKSLRGL